MNKIVLGLVLLAVSVVVHSWIAAYGVEPFTPNSDIVLGNNSLIFNEFSPELVTVHPVEILFRTHTGNNPTVLTVEPNGNTTSDSLRAQIRVVNIWNRTQFDVPATYQPLAFLALTSTDSRLILESSSYGNQPILPLEFNLSNCPTTSLNCNTIQAVKINSDGTVNFNNLGIYGLTSKDNIVISKQAPAVILTGSSPDYTGKIYSRNEPSTGGDSLVIYTRGPAPNLDDIPRITLTGATQQAEMQVENTDIVISDSGDIVLGTQQGTKIGTSNNQKIAFFGATPISQQTGGDRTADLNYTEDEKIMLQKVYDALRAYGLLS